VAIPVADDQPGIAARIQWRGVGVVLPFRKLSATRLKGLIDNVLTDVRYRSNVLRLQAEIEAINGTERAAEIVEAQLL
jgi:UDP:flavonoid glycosyltransferase YjiC (YdhE family)